MNTFACTATPDQKLKVLKGAIDAEKVACGAYLLDPKIPKDDSVTEHCIIVINGCSKIVVNKEVRNVGGN